LNQEVKARLKELPVFLFDDCGFEATLRQREKRSVVVMANGARYWGEWVSGNFSR
jgi:hypothetical protein